MSRRYFTILKIDKQTDTEEVVCNLIIILRSFVKILLKNE